MNANSLAVQFLSPIFGPSCSSPAFSTPAFLTVFQILVRTFSHPTPTLTPAITLTCRLLYGGRYSAASVGEMSGDRTIVMRRLSAARRTGGLANATCCGGRRLLTFRTSDLAKNAFFISDSWRRTTTTALTTSRRGRTNVCGGGPSMCVCCAFYRLSTVIVWRHWPPTQGTSHTGHSRKSVWHSTRHFTRRSRWWRHFRDESSRHAITPRVHQNWARPIWPK